MIANDQAHRRRATPAPIRSNVNTGAGTKQDRLTLRPMHRWDINHGLLPEPTLLGS